MRGAMTGLLAAAAALATPAAAQSGGEDAERRTAAVLERVRQSPPRLRIFLAAMPKGGDLHNHMGGGTYAEDYIRWAGEAGLCIDTAAWRIASPPCDAPGHVPARGLEEDYPRYSRTIDAFSTRGFEQGVGDPTVSGYDRFFATFDAFGAVWQQSQAKSLAATRAQAAADHVSYVELGTGSSAARSLMTALPGSDGTDFPTMMARIAPLIPAAVKRTIAEYDAMEAQAAAIEGCGTKAARPACAVGVRYLPTVFRNVTPAAAFAQAALMFALVEADPRFVGVNIAAPEHHPIAVRDYALHMRMFAWLRARHPKVPLSLHAGELALGMVPPRELAFHIRDAVEVAGARRIGHGVDIPYETDAPALLKEMAVKGVGVEINLTSNAVILGIKGAAHPLSLYRDYGVPVMLSTDDEGVSRSDMTNEYQRGVTEQGLTYPDLKEMARNSLHFSFLPGASLWATPRGYTVRTAACTTEGARCDTFLRANPKAAAEMRLEREFTAFEAGQP